MPKDKNKNYRIVENIVDTSDNPHIYSEYDSFAEALHALVAYERLLYTTHHATTAIVASQGTAYFTWQEKTQARRAGGKLVRVQIEAIND